MIPILREKDEGKSPNLFLQNYNPITKKIKIKKDYIRKDQYHLRTYGRNNSSNSNWAKYNTL